MQEGLKRMAARPTREDLDHFRAVSPIAHVGAVQAAMLFMLGAKDRRWPPLPAGSRGIACAGGSPASRVNVPTLPLFAGSVCQRLSRS